MTRKGARPRLEVGSDAGAESRGSFLWIALACAIMFLVGATLFILLGREQIGEPVPDPDPSGQGE